jgi:hypothetical protein
MLQSVQQRERRGGFRQRFFETRRDDLEFRAIARIQGTEVEVPQPVFSDAHERLERLMRRAVHRPEQGPE